MQITDSKVKFVKDGNIYTLLQKDENSKIKFYNDDGVINIATKQEVIDNLPNITYLDTIKIYYYLNGECVQLAVKEDIEMPNVYSLQFNNNDQFEVTRNIMRYARFSTIASLNVEKTDSFIYYNDKNTDIKYDSNVCIAYENGIALDTEATDEVQAIIDCASDTEVVTQYINQDPLTGAMLSITDLDVTKTIYNITENIDDGSYTLNEYAIQDPLLGSKISTVSLDVTKMTYDLSGDVSSDYTLNNSTIQTFYSTLSYVEVEAE